MEAFLNLDLIHKETDKAFLLQIPDKRDWGFWYPKRFCRKGSEYLKVWFPDHFKAKPLKLGKSKEVEEEQFLKNILKNQLKKG